MLVAQAPVPREQFSLVNDDEKATEGDVMLEPIQPELTEQLPKEGTEVPLAAGLQQLETVEKLHITKKVDMKQLLSLQNQRERYIIRAPNQRLVYSVVEENSWWLGFLCYGLRPLQLRIYNEAGEEVIRILRPFAFTTRVTPCQLQRMEVYSPPGTKIGTIEQQWSSLKPLYHVKGQQGEELFSLRGPAYGLGIYRDLHFDICRPDGSAVGSTTKRWRGVVHALFRAPMLDKQHMADGNDVGSISKRCRGVVHALFRAPMLDKFVVAFEQDLAVEEKALLLASTLLVDYMYYDT